MKVKDLTNEQLDHWVARAQGWARVPKSLALPDGQAMWATLENGLVKTGECEVSDYTPSTNGQQCFELIEKFKMTLLWETSHNKWMGVSTKGDLYNLADTPQVAVCKAVVASVFGDEVSDD